MERGSQLTTVTTHAKILCHLDPFGRRIRHEVPRDGQLLAVPTENRGHGFIGVERSSDPAGVEVMAMLHELVGQSIEMCIDLRRSRMRSIMSSKFLRQHSKGSFRSCSFQDEPSRLTYICRLVAVHERPGFFFMPLRCNSRRMSDALSRSPDAA